MGGKRERNHISPLQSNLLEVCLEGEYDVSSDPLLNIFPLCFFIISNPFPTSSLLLLLIRNSQEVPPRHWPSTLSTLPHETTTKHMEAGHTCRRDEDNIHELAYSKWEWVQCTFNETPRVQNFLIWETPYGSMVWLWVLMSPIVFLVPVTP